MRIVKFSLIALVLLVGAAIWASGQLTGNEILKKVDERSGFGIEGDLVSIVTFDIVNPDGTTSSNKFAFFSKRIAGEPERLLIYFLEPEDVRGSIFLSIDPIDPKEDARLWLYLPALGVVKELIAEGERKARFAGSNFSREEIGGGFELAQDYEAELVAEETLQIREEMRPVYVLNLTAKPEAEVDFPTRKLWVDKVEFLVFKGEDNNKAGNLERIFEMQELGRFEERTVPNKIYVKNVLDGSSTTITILERWRAELPDSIFIPENLPNFNPADYGVRD